MIDRMNLIKNKDLEEKLRGVVNEIHPLSHRAFNDFLDLIVCETIAKGIFIRKGQQTSSEYFILEGLVRTYVESPNGKDVSLNFYPDQSILSPYKTRTKAGISTIWVEALAQTELAAIDVKALFELAAKSEEIRIFMTRVIENDLLEKSSKEIMLASMTGKEKLAFFRERFPTLENYAPHIHIASYCGITNVSLSRFRAMKSLQ